MINLYHFHQNLHWFTKPKILDLTYMYSLEASLYSPSCREGLFSETSPTY